MLQATKVSTSSLDRAMSRLVVQERHLWLCLVDIGTPTKFGSSRSLCPRLASSATQSRTQPSSFQLHRRRLRRSNTSCPGGQPLPPPVRRLQRPGLLVAEGSPLHPPLLPSCIHNSLQKQRRGAGRRQAGPPVKSGDE